MRNLRENGWMLQNHALADVFIEKGGIQILSQFIRSEQTNSQIKEEAIWVLNNVTLVSGDYED